jgi:hypothetical protein
VTSELVESANPHAHHFSFETCRRAPRLLHHRRIEQNRAAIRKRSLSGMRTSPPRRFPGPLAPSPVEFQIALERLRFAAHFSGRPFEGSANGGDELREKCLRQRQFDRPRSRAAIRKRAPRQAPDLHGNRQQRFATDGRLHLAQARGIPRKFAPVVAFRVRAHKLLNHAAARDRLHQPVREFVRVCDKKSASARHAGTNLPKPRQQRKQNLK